MGTVKNKLKVVIDFPNSPEIGTELTPTINGYECRGFILPYAEYAKYPSFFEQIPFNYKILNKHYGDIASVRRLTDGEIFSIGDIFTNTSANQRDPDLSWVISGFEAVYSTVIVYNSTNSGKKVENCGIGACIKIKDRNQKL